MNSFFAWCIKHKKIFSQHLKLESKIMGTLFLDFVLFFNIGAEKFGKKIIWSSWSSQKDFSKPKISQCRAEILEIRLIN